MFLKPEDFTDKQEYLYSQAKIVIDLFFKGKLILSDISFSEDYNAFYYSLKKDNNSLYTVSVHFKDYDIENWMPYECFFITVGFKDNNDWKLLTFYFDDKDKKLAKRILGKAARDSVSYINKWGPKMILLSKDSMIEHFKEDNNPSTTQDNNRRAKRERVLNILNSGLKDFRYEDFIDK